MSVPSTVTRAPTPLLCQDSQCKWDLPAVIPEAQPGDDFKSVAVRRGLAESGMKIRFIEIFDTSLRNLLVDLYVDRLSGGDSLMGQKWITSMLKNHSNRISGKSLKGLFNVESTRRAVLQIIGIHHCIDQPREMNLGEQAFRSLLFNHPAFHQLYASAKPLRCPHAFLFDNHTLRYPEWPIPTFHAGTSAKYRLRPLARSQFYTAKFKLSSSTGRWSAKRGGMRHDGSWRYQRLWKSLIVKLALPSKNLSRLINTPIPFVLSFSIYPLLQLFSNSTTPVSVSLFRQWKSTRLLNIVLREVMRKRFN